MSPYAGYTLSDRPRSIAEIWVMDAQIGAFAASLTTSVVRMRRFAARLIGRGRRSPSLAAAAGPAPAGVLLGSAARGRWS
ncbi:MAG: hypothetical protein ABSC16_03590 [Candidatus Dormibacteria bacterium]|jgi:hypothetical protein|nr:hypothetical protein [Chloroflexota bacterium]HBV95034.1 hypothetical protein [Chloroflexota bacterium]